MDHEHFKIKYFKVGNTPGGNQDWFVDWWMNIGGCGALAACDLCICLAKYHGYDRAVPFPTKHITQDMYLELGMKMKPYIHPRIGGVSKISYFTDGMGKYLKDQGYEGTFTSCPGEEAVEKAMEFIKEQLAKNIPIACLLLRHKNKEFKDITWHWFMITGYDMKEDDMILTYHTYGEICHIILKEMWNTGYSKKGGLVTIVPQKHLLQSGKIL